MTSSSFDKITSVAYLFNSSCAFPIATPHPTVCSISISFNPSPKAMAFSGFNHNFSNDEKALRVRVGLNGGGNNNGTDKAPDKKWLIMREQFHEREELPRVPTGKTYKIEAKYDSNTGLIYEIQVWEK